MEHTPIYEELTVQEETEQESTQQEIPAEEASAPDTVSETDSRPVETVTVCDIQFRNNSKVYYFAPGEINVKTEDDVVIETSRGLEFGHCVRGNHVLPIHETISPLRPVVRIATEQDKVIDRNNREREKKAFQICMKKIEELKLDMQLVSAECAFDGSKILFFFTADERVDFRELVKLLGYALHSRIELRQIGVRDKAKMVGGLGICGRPFCCGQFLQDFQPVSIKMAKTQNLSLNPTKISGTCGRLMCCLNYEQAAYEDLHRTSPKAESFVDTPDGRGTVTEVNLLKQSVKVRLEKQPDTIVCHKNCDICVLRSGKAKKTDEPIPEDLAPISGGKQEKKQEKPAFSAYLDPVFSAKNGSVQEDKKANRRRNGKPQRQGDAIEQEMKLPKKEAKAPQQESKQEPKTLEEILSPKAGKKNNQKPNRKDPKQKKHNSPKTPDSKDPEAPDRSKQDQPTKESPKKDNPKKEGGRKEAPNKDSSGRDNPNREAGQKDTPKKESAPKESPAQDSTDTPAQEGAPKKNKSHYYHRYHKHRKPGPKAEG